VGILPKYCAPQSTLFTKIQKGVDFLKIIWYDKKNMQASVLAHEKEGYLSLI